MTNFKQMNETKNLLDILFESLYLKWMTVYGHGDDNNEWILTIEPPNVEHYTTLYYQIINIEEDFNEFVCINFYNGENIRLSLCDDFTISDKNPNVKQII